MSYYFCLEIRKPHTDFVHTGITRKILISLQQKAYHKIEYSDPFSAGLDLVGLLLPPLEMLQRLILCLVNSWDIHSQRRAGHPNHRYIEVDGR
uniref:Uncharacterized protein n=1 Tax=Pyxicephalus adspersus TaxID=30357 RepID=A0AAV3ADL6_PYXAD|nr:TPA: hypothetical protein GDO54_018015 [Pyxicephalus adspersus]